MLEPEHHKSKSNPLEELSAHEKLITPTPPLRRSLKDEIPYALVLRDASAELLEQIRSELFPNLSSSLLSELHSLVEKGHCFTGAALREAYFDKAPLSIRQQRTFSLSTSQDTREDLHAITLIDERCQPEYPTLEIFKLKQFCQEPALRFQFDTLSVSERWTLVNHLGSFCGLPQLSKAFQTLPEDNAERGSFGSSWCKISESVFLETLSTNQPLPTPEIAKDRKRGPSSWTIEAVEYSEPDYHEQGALLRQIDPKEFAPQPGRNLLSSLLLHLARNFVTQEGDISISKLDRARKHIDENLSVTFERRMALGEPDLDSASFEDDLPIADGLEKGEDELFAPPQEYDAEEDDVESKESVIDSVFESGLLHEHYPQEEEDSLKLESEDVFSEMLDFGTSSLVRIESRQSRYGEYRVVFSSEAVVPCTDQINDDSQFNKKAPTIRVDFLDSHNAPVRWKLIPSLHGNLPEMQVPEDEAHNLDRLEKEFRLSDIASAGERVTLYLGRLRITASRE